MNYVMYYDFDNFDSIYECIPSVRNGVAFGMFDCIVKFYTMNDNQVTFWINGSNHTKKKQRESLRKFQSYFRTFLRCQFMARKIGISRLNGACRPIICYLKNQ